MRSMLNWFVILGFGLGSILGSMQQVVPYAKTYICVDMTNIFCGFNMWLNPTYSCIVFP